MICVDTENICLKEYNDSWTEGPIQKCSPNANLLD